MVPIANMDQRGEFSLPCITKISKKFAWVVCFIEQRTNIHSLIYTIHIILVCCVLYLYMHVYVYIYISVYIYI